MNSETIVAVFDEPTAASRAIEALGTAGIPRNAIHHYERTDEAKGENTESSDVETHHHTGFWSWLTGGEANHEHHALYDQTVKSGGTVVTVVCEGNQVDEIYRVLEQYGPIDLEERHSQYQTSGAYGATSDIAGNGNVADAGLNDVAPTGGVASSGAALGGAGSGDVRSGGNASAAAEQVIPLAEEQLELGRRDVDRGTTRVRRYTVSRPVEEHIRLRDEAVSVLRRPVHGDPTVGPDAFTDREISATEIDEEAVIGKTAHVVEEVVLKKDVSHHDETVHDTVRREEIEVTGPKGHEIEKTNDRKI